MKGIHIIWNKYTLMNHCSECISNLKDNEKFIFQKPYQNKYQINISKPYILRCKIIFRLHEGESIFQWKVIFSRTIANLRFLLFAAKQDEMMATDFSLLVGLSVALTVFLIVTLTSIKILRRKGTNPSIYTMTNLSK